MKQWIAYILLASILISNTEIHEVIMLPSLYTHYKEHNTGEKSMGFAEFIHSHYINDKDHQDDEKEAKMPFKGHFCAVFVALYHHVSDYSIVIDLPSPVRVQTTGKTFVNSIFQNNIWQPPKFC